MCDLPAELDFGNVITDDVGTQRFTLRNPTELPAEAMLGEISSGSGDNEAFLFAAESARGTVALDPNSSRDVVIEFRPTAQKTYLAHLKARASAECPEKIVQLNGTGVASVLSWTPTKVDFKYVSPGVEVNRELTFSNAGPIDAELDQLKTMPNNEFRVAVAAGEDPTKLTVPAATRGPDGKWTPGTAKLTVAFKPVVLGIRIAKLRFRTNLVKQPGGDVDLTGFGGGPDIQVNPSSALNFGRVAYFAGSNAFQTRKLVVMNVGPRRQPSDIEANLHIKDVEVVEVVPSGEFSATLVGYDSMKGLEAKPPKNTVVVEVKITPTSVGSKSATLAHHLQRPGRGDRGHPALRQRRAPASRATIR